MHICHAYCVFDLVIAFTYRWFHKYLVVFLLNLGKVRSKDLLIDLWLCAKTFNKTKLKLAQNFPEDIGLTNHVKWPTVRLE